MAYDTKFIKTDSTGINPVPQHFNPTADDYEPTYGRNNALRVELYGADGNPLGPATSAKQDSIIGYVDGIEAVLGTAVGSPADNTLAARLKDLLTGIVLAAGSAIIGKVGIDQTTPGMTNLVQIGGTITPTHSTATVGTSSGSVLALNSNRKYALFINDSDTVIYLKIGGAASLNQGIRLNADGGAYEMSANIGNLSTGQVYAISSAASKNLLVLEGA